MSFSLETILPVESWKIILSLAFVLAAALLVTLSSSRALSQVMTFLSLSAPVTVLLALDSYIQLARWERMYNDDGVAGSHVIEGYTLNARRFRAQRNFYLSFFSIILQAALFLAHRQAKRIQRLEAKSATVSKNRAQEDAKILEDREKRA